MSVTRPTIAHRRCISSWVSALVALSWWLASETARAQPPDLSRARVVELVTRAPEARVAEAEVRVSRAAVRAAGALSLEEPVLSGMGGVRVNADGRQTFSGVASLSWPVDFGGKRGAREGAAVAEQREAEATLSVQTRRVLLAALLQHAAVLRDERKLALAEARRTNSVRVMESARKRREAGSVPELDVSLAALQLARDTADALTAGGERDADLHRLEALLGLVSEQRSRATGALVPEAEPPPIDLMLRQIEQRAPVREAAARVEAAKARAGRESSAGAPTINLLAQYERDDDANVGMLGVAVPLPVLNGNRLARATSSAAIQAARAREKATRALAVAETRELYARYAATRRAVESLAPTEATVSEAMALATRAYELGEGDLASVLLVHREALDAQRALLDAEHAHAVAKLELLVASGRTPK
jgi:cobalt-zinc-cadmium efflux system outer membrane protein